MIWMKGYYFHKPRFVRSAAGKRVGFGFFRWLVYWRRAAKAVASEAAGPAQPEKGSKVE